MSKQREDLKDKMTKVVYIIGHSTRPIGAFLGIIQAHSIDTLVDVRTIPKSRHNPQFNSDTLKTSLGAAGIGYVHLKELGGLRHPLKDSPNTGWRNPSFRGFADYMLTDEFEEGINELIRLAEKRTVAIMCAEGNPFRCHRSLIADALVVRGVKAIHVSSKKPGRPHALTPFAKVEGSHITYPQGQDTEKLSGAPPQR
jgi:uncharacterized protein (DUF488 family)